MEASDEDLMSNLLSANNDMNSTTNMFRENPVEYGRVTEDPTTCGTGMLNADLMDDACDSNLPELAHGMSGDYDSFQNQNSADETPPSMKGPVMSAETKEKLLAQQLKFAMAFKQPNMTFRPAEASTEPTNINSWMEQEPSEDEDYEKASAE